MWNVFRYSFDHGFCKNIFKHPQSSLEAAKHFAERVEARGFTSNLASKYIKDTIEHKRIERSDPLNSPIELNHPYDSNNIIAVTTVGYEGRGTVLKQLSVEAARDIQRLGNIHLGKKAYYELGRILRQEGIYLPLNSEIICTGYSYSNFLRLQSCSFTCWDSTSFK